jgi:hypothetical protein
MPAKSQSQQRLMAAAAHGATFPKARQIQASMSLGQMKDFETGSMQGKPVYVPKAKSAAAVAPKMKPAPKMKAAARQPHANLGAFLHAAKK